MTSNSRLRSLISGAKEGHDKVMTKSCKTRLEETRTEEKRVEDKSQQRFKKPTAHEVEEYAKSIDFSLNGQQFIDYYQAKGWMIGKNKMKDWKAAVRTWKSRESKNKPQEKTYDMWE
jgi:hypothetical protein